MLKKEEAVKFLNRPLTTAEDANYSLYLKIAKQRLSEMLCMKLSTEAEERTYETRINYQTVYIDPFTAITSITIDGEAVDEDDYTVKQNDSYNASWYNIIEFDRPRRGEKIVVDADWGFGNCPTDLQLLLAKIFAQGSVEQTAENNVKSKKIEDFTVTYKDSATFDDLILSNKGVIDKYSMCNQGYIRHGRRVRPLYYR